MPGLNFDYTQFLKKQNALYLLKYQNDPITVPENPSPIAGYHGHVPNYRSSIHEQRMVRSLVRCLTSPTKPTTATGFKSASNRFPSLKRPSTAVSQVLVDPHETKNDAKVKEEKLKRAQSAPPEVKREDKNSIFTPRNTRGEAESTSLVKPKLAPSRISMMSAGSSEKIRRDARVFSSQIPRAFSRPFVQKTSPRPQSTASTVSERPITRLPVSKHPSGYSQTLYGASFWYMWPDEGKISTHASRPESYDQDRRLNRNDHVIYHKHEGVVPKYMGYVPGYKFRHGSTYGVLTSHPESYGAVFKRDITGH